MLNQDKNNQHHEYNIHGVDCFYKRATATLF